MEVKVAGRAPLTRRALLTSIAAGTSTGLLWAGGILSARHSELTTTIIGSGASQLALIDAPKARVLLVIGKDPAYLLGQLPSLMGVLRQRIDIIVGPPALRQLLDQEFHQRWRVGEMLLLPDTDGAEEDEAERPQQPGVLTQPATIELDHGVDLTIRPLFWHHWTPERASESSWIAHTISRAGSVSFAPSLNTFSRDTEQHDGTVVAPNGDITLLLRRQPVIAIAVNASHAPPAPHVVDEESGVHLVRIYSSDAATFAFQEHGVVLPGWAAPLMSPTALVRESER